MGGAVKFQMAVLLTSDLPPLPAGVRIVEDYGPLDIVVADAVTLATRTVRGDHVVIETTELALRAWLGHTKVWLGVGGVQAEHFELVGLMPELYPKKSEQKD